jgi:hypothetical protein
MAAEEGFEHYHIPQQSRREKLRFLPQNQPNFIESSTTLHPNYPPLPSPYDPSLISSIFLSSTNQNHTIMNNTNPLLYQPQNLREFNHSYTDVGSSNNSEVILLKSEPLSLSSHKNNQNQNQMNIHHPGSVVDVSRNTVPLGPFTGYASVLKGSRFLKPAQQLLDEICYVGVRADEKIATAVDASLILENYYDQESNETVNGADDTLGDGNNEGRKNKSRLLTVLDEVHFLKFFFNEFVIFLCVICN